MPKLKTKPDDREAIALAAWDAIEDLRRWRRNAKGNLVLEWEGQRLTVFSRKGRYFWCRAYEDGETEFSSQGYRNQNVAVAALAELIGRELYEVM